MARLAFAILAPVKVLNTILGGGIIRSGGRTKYIMIIDMLGTWLVGVPLGLYAGLVLKLPIVWTYFILSQEELFRLVLTIDGFSYCLKTDIVEDKYLKIKNSSIFEEETK